MQSEYPNSPYVFSGERKGPLTDSTVRKMVARAGQAAGLEFPIHPHMLRHAAGYKLANDGQDTRSIQAYLGHRVRLDPSLFFYNFSTRFIEAVRSRTLFGGDTAAFAGSHKLIERHHCDSPRIGIG